MRRNIVFTLTGPDRVGLVESVTKLLLAHSANVESSRMARLGGEFAMLALVSLPAEKLPQIDRDLDALTANGYKVTTTPTEPGYSATPRGWRAFQIEVEGADHEGIIHEVARYLSERGINIESMETGVTPAPITGTPLFNMTAIVAVPPALADRSWEVALQEAGNHLNVDITLSPVTK
ncbi:ACT domain-containing protein [Geomonas sp. RF6]|uniref:glycine cleavage system protein R n=1 Tax=Geomonas sp. RF6 TaxID=2897342 RepID=UPI001E5B2EA2|nr:ACT domain-containing protein [Geomonas sp. RF6]UFS69311.1 ACT domain-containing protein [Geomonas sp. RF6]